MKRTWILVALGGVLLVMLAVTYSLIGLMTGVYSCPAIIRWMDGTNAYLVRRGDDWYGMEIGDGLSAPEVHRLDQSKWVVRQGVWSVTVTELDTGAVISAYTPWHLADVNRLTVGQYRHLGR